MRTKALTLCIFSACLLSLSLVSSQTAKHWSFQPLSSLVQPRTRAKAWAKSPVDPFILASLEKQGLAPTREAPLPTLIRRLYFDVVGLPPKPDEVEAFVNDKDPKAYESLVDRLLASPHFGERWGRHWLDVARYADSDGQEADSDRPNAYRYRDFVIRAINEDMPFDQFVRWQLAGDEYEPENPFAVAATGFVVAGPFAYLPDRLLEEERIRERYNELDDIVTTTGQAFLALTMGCARCHDHKYDPIPTRDYYRMEAAFNSGNRADVPLIPRAEADPLLKAGQEWQKKLEAARKAKDDAAVKALEASRPQAVPMAYGISDASAKPAESWVLDRGDFRLRKEPASLGFLTTLLPKKSVSDYWATAKAGGSRKDTTYQRRAMADWMTDTKDGAGALLARVIVNRLWQGHFGEGLSRTVNDLGKRGEMPSHPELLEWLSSELVKGGWKLKPIHRMILLSAVYRQDTTFNAAAAKADPENRLLWRRRPRRIEAEIFRDSMLSVAGTLNEQAYGPAFKPPIQSEAMQARNLKDPYPSRVRDSNENRRRSVYMFHKRVVQYPFTQAFDGPDGSASCGRRNITTVAPQALAVLNEPFIRLRATEFARRLQREVGKDATAQVSRAYVLALGRPPTNSELKAGVAFLSDRATARSGRGKSEDAELLALTDYAQVIFGLNEFVYVD